MDNKNEVREFLTSRRANLTPEKAGVPGGGNRRVAGLRRGEVAALAGVEDYGAGMSATFLDYDNDGHLDLYTGNMWTAAGLQIKADAKGRSGVLYASA